MKYQLTPEAKNSYKIGVDEIVGLKQAMIEVITPIKNKIKNDIYWSDVALDDVEYKSRDGFIAHSHNCGGVRIQEIIPKCEEYNFGYLEFGECEYGDDPEFIGTCGPDGSGCTCDDDGYLSAKLEVWLKFEGVDDDGNLNFYLILHGGNNDAPYFRQSNDIFEAEFSCKSVSELKRVAAKHIKKLLEVIS